MIRPQVFALVLATAFLHSSLAQATSSTSFACTAAAQGMKFKFQISAVGEADLFVEQNKFKSHCELNMLRFDDLHRGTVPRYLMRLALGECTPALQDSLKTEVRQQIRMSVNVPVPGSTKRVANTLVLASEDTLPCKVEKLKESDFRLNAKRWKHGSPLDTN